MQEVAPSAVTMAVAIDAISCTINLTVSFLLIIFNVQCLMFNVQCKARGRSPNRLVALAGVIATSLVAAGVAATVAAGVTTLVLVLVARRILRILHLAAG